MYCDVATYWLALTGVACSTASISKVFVYDILTYCSYIFFILDVLYCNQITFYLCNQPPDIDIKLTLVLIPV